MATALQDEQEAAARIRSITAADRGELGQLEVQAASTGSELTDLKMDARDQRARLLATLNDRRDHEDASRWFSTSQAEKDIRVAIAELEVSGDVSAEAMAEIDKLTAAKNALAGELAANEAFAQQLTDFDSPTAVTGPNGWRKTAVQLLRGEITYDSSNPTHQEAMQKIGEDNMARNAPGDHANFSRQDEALRNAAYQAAGEDLLSKVQAARTSGNQQAIRASMTLLATSMLERGNNQAQQIANSVAIQTNTRLGELRQTHQSTMQTVIATSQDQHIGADGGIDYIYGSERTKLISAGDIRGMAAFLGSDEDYVAEINANYRAASGPHAGKPLQAKIIEGVGVVVKVRGVDMKWEAIHNDGMFDAQHTMGAAIPTILEFGAAGIGWGLKILGVIAAPATGGLSLVAAMAISGALTAAAELGIQAVGAATGYRTSAGAGWFNFGDVALAGLVGAGFPGAGAALRKVAEYVPVVEPLSKGVDWISAKVASILTKTEADGTVGLNGVGSAVYASSARPAAALGRRFTGPSDGRLARNTIGAAYRIAQQRRMTQLGETMDSSEGMTLALIRAELSRVPLPGADPIFGTADEIKEMSAAQLWKRWSSVRDEHGLWMNPKDNSKASNGIAKLEKQLMAQDAVQDAVEKEIRYLTNSDFDLMDLDPASTEARRLVRHVSYRQQMEEISEAGREISGDGGDYLTHTERAAGTSASWTWQVTDGPRGTAVGLTRRAIQGQELSIDAEAYRKVVIEEAQSLYEQIVHGDAIEFLAVDGKLPAVFGGQVGQSVTFLQDSTTLALIGDQFHAKLRKQIGVRLDQMPSSRIDSEKLTEILMRNERIAEGIHDLDLPSSGRVSRSDFEGTIDVIAEEGVPGDILFAEASQRAAERAQEAVISRRVSIAKALGMDEPEEATAETIIGEVNRLRFGGAETFNGKPVADLTPDEVTQFNQRGLLPSRDDTVRQLDGIEVYVKSLEEIEDSLKGSISAFKAQASEGREKLTSGLEKAAKTAADEVDAVHQAAVKQLVDSLTGDSREAKDNANDIMVAWVSKERSDTIDALKGRYAEDSPEAQLLSELATSEELQAALLKQAGEQLSSILSNRDIALELLSRVAASSDSNFIPGLPTTLSEDGINNFVEQLSALTAQDSTIRAHILGAFKKE